MAADAGVDGAEQLAELGRRLKAAGDGSLRRELLSGIRTAVNRMVPDVQRGADRLPRSGGLSSRVAAQKFAARTSLASGKVSLTGSGMKELSDIDAGRVRHRVFGQNIWKQQSVTPGFFSDPVKSDLPKVQTEVEQVMTATAKKLEKPL